MTDLLVTELMRHWASVREGLLATIAKFSDADLPYRPFEGAYSVAQLMLHIADEEDIELHWGLMRQLEAMPAARDPATFPDVASIVAAITQVRALTQQDAASFSDHAVQSEVTAAWGAAVRPIDMLWHVMEHEVHHRAELSLILGLLGREGLDA